MHIPDSVISPSTCAVAAVAMTPVWALAARNGRSLGQRRMPLLALGSAFCFTIMMFNIPALGGTTAHPVGGTLLAVMLGPWLATLGVTTALIVQAVCFGDGGLLAIGANSFTMAFVLPFVGYTIYRLLAARADGKSRRRAVAAAIGAFVGLNAGAAIVAVILGLQPILFHDAAGHALYFPFGIKITAPAMLGTHLLIAGPAEAIVTFLAVRYLQAAGIPLHGVDSNAAGSGRVSRLEPLWVGLLALVALTPLGLLAKGDAWGEWDRDGLRQQIQRVEGNGYVPSGVANAPDYHGVRGLEDYGAERGRLGYVAAALVGTGIIVTTLMVAGRLTRRSNADDAPVRHKPIAAANDDGLPDWLTRPNEAPTLERTRRPHRFVERTVEDLTRAGAVAMSSEESARRDGFLQRRDARSKLLIVAVLTLVVVTRASLAAVLVVQLGALGVAIASGVPLGRWLARAWLTVPLFVGAVVLPAAFNVVTPGKPLLRFALLPGIYVTVTGAKLVLLLFARAAVVLAMVGLLTATTRVSDLLAGTRRLGAPALIVTLIGMCHRYVLTLLNAASDRFTARLARTVGPTPAANGRGFVGGAIGHLFVRSIHLTDEVYDAMRARGWSGGAVASSRLCWRLADTAWVTAAALCGLLALGVDHALK